VPFQAGLAVHTFNLIFKSMHLPLNMLSSSVNGIQNKVTNISATAKFTMNTFVTFLMPNYSVSNSFLFENTTLRSFSMAFNVSNFSEFNKYHSDSHPEQWPLIIHEEFTIVLLCFVIKVPCIDSDLIYRAALYRQ
jgi:hypothetical protein